MVKRLGGYAVIYDTTDEDGEETEYSYYEVFDTPAEAKRIFRDAFPVGVSNANNARLVEIVCNIDDADELTGGANG